jgi:hypothetical protein
MTAPALGLQVQDKFQLYIYKKGGLALVVVTQLQGSHSPARELIK